jgi:long-chain acyl-CoA synthetase
VSESLKTPLEMFYHWEANAADDVFLRQPIARQWREFTWQEVADRVRRLAAFIDARGFAPGSRIAILSSNCADWFMVDLAIMLAGHVSVPLYPGQDVESARYILEHCEAQLIFVGQFDQSAKVAQMLPADLPRIAMHGCQVDCDFQVSSLTQSDTRFEASPVPELEALMTILYTSGTTGNPKGVMHSHGTAARVMPRHLRVMAYSDDGARERLFSFLPLSHAAERIMIEMRAIYSNPVVAFSEGLETFGDELREVKPTIFFAVPRLWTKFKAGIDAKVPPEVQAKFGEEDKAKVRVMLGLDQAKAVLTGSAPTPKDIHQWYLDMGIQLREGYSMTENFIDGCFYMSEDDPVPGSVGWPLEGVEVKITDDDEICFRSDGLMKGYYKEPEKTAEVLVDGWYHTGDSGRIDEQGRVTVTGRISEVFKTSKGKFISPSRIEDKFGSVAELGQLCVCGHGEDQPVLLTNLSELADSQPMPALEDKLVAALADINADLPTHERVNRIVITPTEWTIDEGLLTPTLKIKRKVLVEHFAHYISDKSASGPVVWV